MDHNLYSSHSSKQNSIYLDKRSGKDSASFSAEALICRRTEWSPVAFGVILVPSSPLWSHCFSKIFMRYLFVCLRDIRVAVQDWIAGTHQACNLCEYLSFPEWSPSQVFFRDATWPRHAWSPMTAGRPHFPFIGEHAGGCSGQPCRGLTLVCVFALVPCQGKENTWSWSPVLSADIFGKGCWIQVCVWSYASPSQVKHRETQRLLHFSV